MKTFGTILFVVILLQLFFPNSAKAQVVINEVFPNPSGSTSEPNEFIELLNSGDVPIVITGWQISDTQGSIKTYIFPVATLDPGVYVNFRRSVTGIALNNDGDGVELRDPDGNLKDSMSFDQTLEDRSWSRIPNGSGGFVNNTDPTELSINTSPPTPDPTPTATPSPTPTPTPTSAPAATKTPTPSSTKTPTPTPSSAKTSVPTPIKTPSPTPKQSPIKSIEEQTSSESGSVLGIEEASSSSTSNSMSNTHPVPENKNTIIAVILISLGLILIGGSVYLALKTSKSSDLKNDI